MEDEEEEEKPKSKSKGKSQDKKEEKADAKGKGKAPAPAKSEKPKPKPASDAAKGKKEIKQIQGADGEKKLVVSPSSIASSSKAPPPALSTPSSSTPQKASSWSAIFSSGGKKKGGTKRKKEEDEEEEEEEDFQSEEEVEKVAKKRAKVSKTGGGRSKKEDYNDPELPVINNPYEMFKDIVMREPKLLQFAKSFSRPLRVATMCSGTESPLLALDMISRALKELHNVDFVIHHIFSCEIEPFKQAYIERNFAPPILFRDVRELCQDKAATAYGALVDVPGDIDILVAGTSCVDFSNLNNLKKALDGGGQSGETFRGMLRYVLKHRPTMVLLENVCGAPWASMMEKFTVNGYTADHLLLDTKKYYIPHTRMRGYLLAVNQKKSNVPAQWKKRLEDLER
eukprot:Phypoly_transcript_06273.p1 GENE.Phypoly_transcript_06273~~Phypoly_transcript_06273.p1  ORF type:complete len:410 (+),score=146.95 Phypoly_transcript_06273:40-1230(+)